jgi:transmembrane sensor
MTDSADAIRRAALQWQVTLWSGEVTAAERRAFDSWLAAEPAHQQAWQQVQRVGERLHAVPGCIASTVLRSTTRVPKRLNRRALLRGVVLLTSGGIGAYAVRETSQWQIATADHRTARGERRDVTLPDGTRLTLNTATAINLHFSARERLIRLRSGEVLIATAPDDAPVYRPFVVETREGRIRALGTRFTVRRMEEASPEESFVQVFEGAVEIAAHDSGATIRLAAGQQTRFTSVFTHAPVAVKSEAAAWSRGILVAERQRLADFLAELGRYRNGILNCDPAVADLIVSGVYPLDDTDIVLQSLIRALPVSLRVRTPYWITVTTP